VIPAEQLADLRSRHELVAFLTASGVKLRRQGTDYLGFCPFHDDRQPSFSVSPSKQYWCCLGACSTPTKKLGGDVIEFARKLWGVSFRETVQRLGGQTTTQLNTTRPKLRVVKRSSHPETTAPARPDLLSQVATYYHQTLSSSLRAKEYLGERGITNPEIVTSLLIGFADGSLMERAPEGSETHAALAARGVITGKGKELLEGCITVPLRDLHGNVVSLYGRAIERDQHLYLPGPHRGLVNAQVAATTQEIVIAESVIDALSFLEAGISNVVPIYGTNGWTSEHEALIEHHRIARVILALDSDEAGQRAAAALADKLAGNGLDVRVIELPAKDANELLVRDGREAFAATWRRLVAEPVTKPQAAAKEEAAPPPMSSTDEEEKPDVHHDAEAGAYVVSFGARTYRVRGLSAFGVDRMRVNVRVEEAGRFHVDTFDLYSSRSRKNFTEAAVQALAAGPAAAAVISRQIAVLIDVLETQRLILRSEDKSEKAKPVMSIAERDEAMEMLRDPKLVRRLLGDFEEVGCVGEQSSMLIGYLASISRKLDEPLAVLFCARSGAGKSNMQDRITDFIPPEDLVRYTRITGQALFYQDEDALKHKVLALDEEGGATDAIYSLRILQSSGTLSVSATRTDPQTGKHRAEHYEVHGPTSIMLTTAHPEALDYETRNRFVLLTADESSEQTRRILERQRWGETLEGLIAKKKRDAVIRRHRDVQRLIETLHVVNPHAPSLTFPSGRLILRREQKKYLTLIKSIALLHQHQRRRKSVEIAGERIDYIEVTKEDIALAQKLAPSILRRNLDELAPPTRALLDAIRQLVAAKMKELKVPQEYAHISRHELQKETGLSYWHLRVYLQQLVECEYLALVRTENGKRYLYELLDDPDGEDPASEIGG
jgi:DNA primase catalytic core